MAATLTLEIVTPAAVAYSRDVEMVTLPAVDGQIGIYPQHVPLMTRIVPGEIIVAQGRPRRVPCRRRRARRDHRATGSSIVTDMAIAAENIDEARVEAARQRAEARLRDKLSDEEVATVNASLARSLAQLRVKTRHRRS